MPFAAYGPRVHEDYATTPLLGVVFFLGRLLFGGFFLYSGINHFVNVDQLVVVAEQSGVVAPTLAVYATGLLLLLGGASILVGLFPWVGLAFIAIFLIGVTPAAHPYWEIADPVMRSVQMTNFWKNVALLGATLALYVLPRPWPVSFDRAE